MRPRKELEERRDVFSRGTVRMNKVVINRRRDPRVKELSERFYGRRSRDDNGKQRREEVSCECSL